jgi:prepilin-type N-terminal cleavage/methylation domain-containing protein
MQRLHRAAGFTLIELLVVIAILGLLIASFAPDIFGSRLRARIAADQQNLRWHYQQFTLYEQKYKKLPSKTGHKFVLAPWVEGVVQRTEQNMDRYWTPETNDPRKDELKSQEPEQIWRSFDELSSEDTNYAGPGATVVRQLRLGNGKLPLMADDNEFGPAWEDWTINVLLGDGNVKELTILDLQEYGFDSDAEGANFEVGPESAHPLLQQLER